MEIIEQMELHQSKKLLYHIRNEENVGCKDNMAYKVLDLHIIERGSIHCTLFCSVGCKE